MATTRLRDRIIAGIGAFLFLITASGFTVMAILDSRNSNDTANQAIIPEDTATACMIQSTEVANSKLDVPEVFKPEGQAAELQTTDLVEGEGEAVKANDCLVMKYYGTLASDGKMFDENFTTDNALQFQLGTGQVIAGWDKGVEGMKIGGTRRIVIPYADAYGESGRDSIPAKADLVFVVKLLNKVEQ